MWHWCCWSVALVAQVALLLWLCHWCSHTFFLNTISVSSHMYPENPEETRVIVVSMNMGHDIYLILPGIELVQFQVPADSTGPQWLSVAPSGVAPQKYIKFNCMTILWCVSLESISLHYITFLSFKNFVVLCSFSICIMFIFVYYVD